MSDENVLDALKEIDKAFIEIKANWDIDKNFEKFLIYMIKSMKELYKDYDNYNLLFDYIFFVFMSITYGPELVEKNLCSILDNFHEYNNEPVDGYINLFDEKGNRVSLEEINKMS